MITFENVPLTPPVAVRRVYRVPGVKVPVMVTLSAPLSDAVPEAVTLPALVGITPNAMVEVPTPIVKLPLTAQLEVASIVTVPFEVQSWPACAAIDALPLVTALPPAMVRVPLPLFATTTLSVTANAALMVSETVPEFDISLPRVREQACAWASELLI